MLFPPDALSRASVGLKPVISVTLQTLARSLEQPARRVASGGDPPEADRATRRRAEGRGGRPGGGPGSSPAGRQPRPAVPGGHPAAGGEAATPNRGKTSPFNERRAVSSRRGAATAWPAAAPRGMSRRGAASPAPTLPPSSLLAGGRGRGREGDPRRSRLLPCRG